MNPVVVNVAVGGWYPRGQRRLERTLNRHSPEVPLLKWTNEFPPGSPTHEASPYAFKFHAIRIAKENGHDVVLWLDSAIAVMKPIDPILEYIDKTGWYFQYNGWKVGQWCHDAALERLGLTRDEAMEMTDLMGCIVGLDFRNDKANAFLDTMIEMGNDGNIFPGPWNNNDGSCSSDPRVLGHRHDQTAMSVVTARMGVHWIDSDKSKMVYASPDSEVADHVLFVNQGMGQVPE